VGVNDRRLVHIVIGVVTKKVALQAVFRETVFSFKFLGPENSNPLISRYGIALDKVTVAHPTPEYPRVALKLGIDGNVRVTVKVQNGKIIEARASSDAPMLGYDAQQWIVRCWKFRPEVTGVFTIPITYKRQA
jgi:TonB family protein